MKGRERDEKKERNRNRERGGWREVERLEKKSK